MEDLRDGWLADVLDPRTPQASDPATLPPIRPSMSSVVRHVSECVSNGKCSCPMPTADAPAPTPDGPLRTYRGASDAFRLVAEANAARAGRWHPGFPNSSDGWTGADWSNAAAGEMGETCNIVKKLRRIETGTQQAEAPTRAELLAKLATEIGDTYIYLDLLAQFYGLDMHRCIADTFNRVSIREGFPERIEWSRS